MTRDETYLIAKQLDHLTDKEFEEALAIAVETLKQEKEADKANAKEVTQ